MKKNRIKKTRLRRQALSGSEQLSFLPQLDFNPDVPNKHTKKHQALKLLLDHKDICHRDFDKKTDSYRLAAYIRDLKKMGWPILDYWINKQVSKNPRNRRYKCYYVLDYVITKFYENGGVL
jgi:hypothetical protein